MTFFVWGLGYVEVLLVCVCVCLGKGSLLSYCLLHRCSSALCIRCFFFCFCEQFYGFRNEIVEKKTLCVFPESHLYLSQKTGSGKELDILCEA